MSYKPNSLSSKTSSCCPTTTTRVSSAKSAKTRVANPRRVLTSKQVPENTSNGRKVCSTSYFNDMKKAIKPKKTTKSDLCVRKQKEEHLDYCKNCGDTVCSPAHLLQIASTTKSVPPASFNKGDTKNGKSIKKPKPIQQYYKNENYRSTESTEEINNGFKKISLDTIKEVSEKNLSDSIFKIYPEDSEDDITFLVSDDQDSLRQLKEFRQRNYFECHSAKSRIRNRGCVTSLQGHKCVYRFYLNERLFPVPLSIDHNNQVRCVECHLPMELNVKESTKINGTIQAKVTIGKKNQDVMLLLPVKEPLIITEKRKAEKKDTEVVFFGVINLDGFGNSVFNPTLPDNSFALKYQKGYTEFEYKEDYSYSDFNKSDVIVI